MSIVADVYVFVARMDAVGACYILQSNVAHLVILEKPAGRSCSVDNVDCSATSIE